MLELRTIGIMAGAISLCCIYFQFKDVDLSKSLILTMPLMMLIGLQNLKYSQGSGSRSEIHTVSVVLGVGYLTFFQIQAKLGAWVILPAPYCFLVVSFVALSFASTIKARMVTTITSELLKRSGA